LYQLLKDSFSGSQKST